MLAIREACSLQCSVDPVLYSSLIYPLKLVFMICYPVHLSEVLSQSTRVIITFLSRLDQSKTKTESQREIAVALRKVKLMEQQPVVRPPEDELSFSLLCSQPSRKILLQG